MKTAQGIYSTTVQAMPQAEQLRLVSLIMNELVSREPPALVDERDSWSEEDRRELSAFSLNYAAARYPEDEDLVE